MQNENIWKWFWRKSVIDNNIESPTETAQEGIQIIKPNNSYKNNDKGNKENGNVNENGIYLNEWKEGEINKIRNNRPFGNIKFSTKNARSHNRTDISKGQFSMQKDQTDRGLLKSNL